MYQIYLPDRWTPEYARPETGVPQVGWLVAYEHQVWRVLKVTPYTRDQWTDEDWQRIAVRGKQAAPVHVVMRPDGGNETDPVAARNAECSFTAWPFKTQWWVMRDEHYPLCRQCFEPLPCREVWAGAVASRQIRQMARFETEGVCPACNEPVTARQKSITFTENLHVPGGPPVTFHRRGRCRSSALNYERIWVAADPKRRRIELACPGHLINHADSTYECSEKADCRGWDARHDVYQMCEDQECHRNGYFGPYPKRGAVQRSVG